jgi:hypothetical protein
VIASEGLPNGHHRSSLDHRKFRSNGYLVLIQEGPDEAQRAESAFAKGLVPRQDITVYTGKRYYGFDERTDLRIS